MYQFVLCFAAAPNQTKRRTTHFSMTGVANTSFLWKDRELMAMESSTDTTTATVMRMPKRQRSFPVMSTAALFVGKKLPIKIVA
jgi:hypothetical protein